jgi:hypothetical protein
VDIQENEFDWISGELIVEWSDTPRWRNAAQWARNSMVNEDLLKKGSRACVWEISDKGRNHLTQQG